MAEAVRERPRDTKPKAKKTRAKKPQSEAKEPAEVPVPATATPLNVQHDNVSSDLGSAHDIPAACDQSSGVDSTPGSGVQGHLSTQDLEVDGAAVVIEDGRVAPPVVTELASRVKDTLQFDSLVYSDGDPACSGDMIAAATTTGDPDLSSAVEGESESVVVPTADLIHMEVGVNQEQPVPTDDLIQLEENEGQNSTRHQHELSAVSAPFTDSKLQAGDAGVTEKPPLCSVSDVPQEASELTAASVHTIQESPSEQSGFEVPVAASAPVPPLEAMECGSGSEQGQPATASAPMPSLEASVPSLRQQTAEASAPELSLEPRDAEPGEVLPPPAPSAPPVQLVERPAARTTMGLTERRIAESLYPQVPLLESPTTSKFQPMTDEELQQLYYNPELQAMDAFVDDFVQNEEKKTNHEFHEIVMNYYRSRKSHQSVEEDLRQLRKNYDQILAEMWIRHTETKTVDGQCEDKCRVSQVHTSEQCELNKEALANLKTNLVSVRNEMQGDLALFAYSSQMSRLQVESYLHLLFSGNSLLRDMPKDAPVTAVDRTREDFLPQVQKLKDCISVLFTFHRKPTKDLEFINNIRKWTSRLAAALLRVASYGDHLFMLNHVLRAPAGVRKWARDYIQVPAPATLQLQTSLGSAVLDHAVTCLAHILLPVRERETFMCHMKTNVTEASMQMAETWTMVDSDGEEDEDPSQAWLYLHENDVVEILLQLPLQAIFTHILQAPVDNNGTIHYDVSRCTEPSLMKLFAFCSTWISLLGKGLHTYNMARYKNLNKRLGSLIRQTVSFVSDHLLNYKEFYRDLASASSLDHLQLEFDQLFMRATYNILTAQKLGSWQFMAEMPFTSLSSDSVWRLLWMLQQVHGQPLDLKTLPPVDRCKEDMKDIESRRQLADTLQTLPASESIYLLTTFANMAIARPLEEDDFIECITLQVFEIAFICNHTRDFCSKTGRSLLASIIQKHPTAMSMLLRRVQTVMGELGMMSLCLFDELPASIWIPQDPDMLLLRQWLLTKDLDTPENQLARCVISIMNWDLFTETGKLVLDIRLHRQMALLLVESYNKYISDRKASYFIIEGMKQMTSLAEVSREQKFNNWVWSIALRLKLHKGAAILHSRAAESRPFHPPCLEEEQWLLPLSSAAKNKNPLACFLVLSMTDVGHDKDQFISVGLDMLLTLAQSSQFSCVIHVLSCITPLFITTPQYLIENDTFQKVLQILLSADESVLKMTKMALGSEFKAGTITMQLTQMIQASISARLEHGEALPTLLFWIQAIFKVAHFLTDMNCCYVLDHLVRWGFLQKGARDKLEEVFRQYHKQLQSESKSRAGFLAWVSGGSGNPPSLMERASMGECGWLALQVLSVEDDLDQESGVWPSLQQTLLNSPALSLDAALKQVVSSLKPESPRSVGRLLLYRWAQQAIDLPLSHPTMPLVWQRFFSLFLGRCLQQGQLPRRASVGERFLQSGSSMLKKLRKKLGEAADFHLSYNPNDSPKKKGDNLAPCSAPAPHTTPSHFGSESGSPLPSPQTEESPQYSSSKEFHNQLARLYQTFSLWLEEPRLHGADLYLPSLPAPYEAHRLMQMFTPSKNLWLEFVDFEGEQYEITLFAAEWRKIVTGHPQSGQRWATSQPAQRTPKQCIMRRLQRFEDPKPPPSLQPMEAPVPDIPTSILTDKAAAIHLMDSDLSILTNFTKFFSTRAAQQCAVDAAFLDLVPGLYRNVTKVVTLQIECKSRVNPYHRCSGAARASIRVKEMEVNAMVQRKMDENRAEYKQLIIESELPPPQNVCIAAVHVENAITLLIKLSQTTSDPDRKRALCDVACTLFFHLTVQVCEETNFYPPTRQFFASCVEILGQEFVSREPSQTVLLLQFCLDNPGLAGLVAPHFVPNNSPQHLVSMYERLITTLQQQNLNLVFMLLTKFDVLAWLENIRPPADDRTRFVEILGNALMTCGAEPSTSSKMVFDLYLSHLRVVLRHQFPDNLYKVLHLLLQGSSNEALHTKCWEMFLMECCAPLPGTEPSAAAPAAAAPASLAFSVPHVLACSTLPLSTLQLDRMLKWLGGFFRDERVSDGDLVKFGLYPRWGRYVPYVGLLMGLLARSFVAKVLAACDPNNPFDAIQLVWYMQLEMWRAWMEPLTLGVPLAGTTPHGVLPHHVNPPEVVFPWTEGDSSVAVSMVEAFSSTLMFTHTTLAAVTPQYSSTMFSLLLIHYARELCGPQTPPHVIDVLLSEFCKLPWEQLRPDFQVMDMMILVKQMHSSPCFQLIAHIMTRVPWLEVIGHFRGHHDPQVPSLLLEKLLLLLVHCCGDPLVRELPEVCQLLTSAETYEWRGLSKEAYHRASTCFLQVCQPVWILAQRTSPHALGFRLLKRTADFSPEASEAWTRDMSERRLMLVRCVCQQLCQVTYQDNTDPDAVYTVFLNMLSEVEAVETAVLDPQCREEESVAMMKELLSLLNNSQPSGVWHGGLMTIVCQWLQSSQHSVLLTPTIKAASRFIASVAQLVTVVETCIHVYFDSHNETTTTTATKSRKASLTQSSQSQSPPLPQHLAAGAVMICSGWDHILSVMQMPELSMDQYTQEALANGSFLTLHALLLHRRSLCQTLADQAALLNEVLDWTKKAAPTSENEAKLFLWWLEMCGMWLHQLDAGRSVPECVGTMHRFLDLLQPLGEDRASTGILSIIGLGKRSPLSPQFRLAVRSLSAFLSSQILDDTTLRFQPTSPLSEQPRAKQCRAVLSALRTNRTYAPLKDTVESMIGFVHRTDHTARSVLDLITELCHTLYPHCLYLKSSTVH